MTADEIIAWAKRVVATQRTSWTITPEIVEQNRQLCEALRNALETTHKEDA